jgi:hypothetical protein
VLCISIGSLGLLGLEQSNFVCYFPPSADGPSLALLSFCCAFRFDNRKTGLRAERITHSESANTEKELMPGAPPLAGMFYLEYRVSSRRGKEASEDQKRTKVRSWNGLIYNAETESRHRTAALGRQELAR